MENQYLKHKWKPKIHVSASLNKRLKYNELLGGYPVYISIIFLKRMSYIKSRHNLYFKNEKEFEEFFSKDGMNKNVLFDEIDEIRESIAKFLETNTNVNFKYSDWSNSYFVTLNTKKQGTDQITVVCTFDSALEKQLTDLKIKFYQKRKGFKYEKHDSVSLDNNIKKVTIYFTYSKNN